MPRPNIGRRRDVYSIEADTNDHLDAVAAHHGWTIEAGPHKGEPNRSRAVRELAHREARRIERLRARKEARP